MKKQQGKVTLKAEVKKYKNEDKERKMKRKVKTNVKKQYILQPEMNLPDNLIKQNESHIKK